MKISAEIEVMIEELVKKYGVETVRFSSAINMMHYLARSSTIVPPEMSSDHLDIAIKSMMESYAKLSGNDLLHLISCMCDMGKVGDRMNHLMVLDELPEEAVKRASADLIASVMIRGTRPG